MARASKRPESAAFQFRKRVPADVLALVGGPREVKVSLRTGDEAEARRLFRKVEEEHEARWAQVRLGIQDLDDRQVAALAGEVYRDAFRKAGNARDGVTQRSWAALKAQCEALDRDGATMSYDHFLWELDQLHGSGIHEVLGRRGMRLTDGTSERLLKAVHREMKNAFGVLWRQSHGDWSPDANLARFPDVASVGSPEPKRQFQAVWADWLVDAKPKAGTVRRWKPVLDKMFDTLGTRDLSEVTESMLTGWLSGLLQDGLHNNTIGKVHIAAAKRIFSYARRQKVITVDHTVDLAVSNGTKFQADMRGFEDHEAAVILKATLLAPSIKMSAAFAAARRWVPWICAYTGARVNEITHLRACDFSVSEGATILHVKDAAGTAKTGDRDVPLHAHLLEQGFGAFLATKSGAEPLFYAPRDGGSATIPPYQEMGGRLGKWVRGLGITDPRLDPNHAWRHRFKTVAGEADIQERVVDAIQGHAPSTQGRKYGKVSLKARVAAMRRFPRIEIDGSSPSA